MKKWLIMTTLVMVFASVVSAQTAPTYQFNYYSNRNNTVGADATVRIINPGTLGSPISIGHGTICADIYVFNATQAMEECCSCPITANGLLTLSVNGDLVGNPLTGFPPPANGTITVLADNASVCDATAPSTPVSGLLAYATHVQDPVPGSGIYVITEDEFLPSTLTATDFNFLGTACSFVVQLGSGKGTCACPPAV
jgi:hypothetical protein